MLYSVKALGIKVAETRFERMGAAALNARPALEDVATLMMGIERAVFESEGRRGGGSWRQDSKEWLARKQRLGLDPRIGHATLALRRAMTVRGDENQILEVTDNTIVLGTDLPYARTQQRNRPFIKFTLADKQDMRVIMRDYLIGAFKS